MEEIVIDARGLRCPLPMLKVRKAMLAAAPGTQAVILATDPGSGEDLKDFCDVYGCALLSSDTDGGILKAVIKKR